jgi:hypothetical protein
MAQKLINIVSDEWVSMQIKCTFNIEKVSESRGVSFKPYFKLVN